MCDYKKNHVYFYNPYQLIIYFNQLQELPENRCSDNDLSGGANSDSTVEGSKGLLKWKGVVFTPDDGNEGATSPEDSISQITEVDNSCNQVCVTTSNGIAKILNVFSILKTCKS